MQQRIALFLAASDGALLDRCDLGDLAGELLVEKLPPFSASQLRRHQATAGAVFTLYGDDSEHHLTSTHLAVQHNTPSVYS